MPPAELDQVLIAMLAVGLPDPRTAREPQPQGDRRVGDERQEDGGRKPSAPPPPGTDPARGAPKPTIPMAPASPSLPSMKLYRFVVHTMSTVASTTLAPGEASQTQAAEAPSCTASRSAG